MASGNGDHIIDIIIETNDQTGGALGRVQDRLLQFDRGIQRTNERLRRLTNRAHQITLSLIDRVTPQGSRIQNWLRRIAGRTHQITLGLIDRATDRIRSAEAHLFRLTARAYTITVNLKDRATQGLKSIGNNVLQSATGLSGEMLAGAGIGYGIYDTAKTYKNFEQQMSAVGAISGASAAQMEMLTAKAMEMGSKTSFSATEAGKAFEYMAMAGWKTEEMMSGISGVMSLAAASGESLGNVSDIVTDVMTAMHQGADKADEFADVLAAASSNANTNVGLMGYTFKYAAPLAGTLGYSIQDLASVIGLMANAGIKGETAGTALRTMFSNLINPTDEVFTKMQDLGVSFKNADGTIKPLRESMVDLRGKFKTMTAAEKLATAEMLVGKEAMTGFVAVMDASEEDFNKMFHAVDNAAGAAERMAETRLDNLAGDITLLGSAWETLQLSIMQGSNGNFLRELVQGVKADVEKFTKYIEDGFDISDIGRIAMDVLAQIKNKFLELDGVGSVLAGGALIGGLAKITSKTMKLIDYLKEASSLGNGGSSGAGHGGGGSSQSVGVMNVRANVVNLSGPTGGGGPGPIPPGGGRPNGPNPPPGSGGSRLARGLKWAGGIGTALSIASSAYDVYSASEYNKQMAEEADWRIQESNRKAAEQEAAYQGAKSAFERGDISEMEYQNAFDAREAAVKEQHDAIDYQGRVEEQNIDRQNQSIGGAIGSVVGGVLGGLAGSAVAPGAGTAVGAMAGSAAGAEVGEMVGANWGSITAGAGEMWESLKAETSNTAEWMGNKFSEFGTSISDKLSPIRDAAQNEWDYLKNSVGEAVQGMSEKWGSFSSFIGENVWTPIKDTSITALNFVVGLFATVGDMLGEVLAPAADWINENVWTPIKDFASEKWEEISRTASEFATYFGETVWEPLKESASEAWTAISESPGKAIAYLSELWGGFTDWFGTTVWSPISEAAGAAWDVISATAGAAWDSITACFELSASWFDSTVWQPISSAADGVRSAIIGAFEAAWSAVTGIWAAAGSWFETNVINPVKEKFNAIVARGASITGLGGAEAKAYGGFVTSPRTILAGEDGGEVIIPLSPNKRSRALDLFERTGEILSSGGGFGSILGSDMMEDGQGVMDNLLQNDVPGLPAGESNDLPISSTANGSDKTTVSIEMGGISINLTVNGGNSPQSVAEDVLQVIRENMDRIADEAGGKMAEKLNSIWGNQPMFGAS